MGHLSNKKKLTHLNKIESSGSASKRQDTRDQIDLLLVNTLSKENEASAKNESLKSENELFLCESSWSIWSSHQKEKSNGSYWNHASNYETEFVDD